jgi:hypothetical protein
MQVKVDESMARVDESALQVEDWWNRLSQLEQKNPINVAKYEAANKLLATAGMVLTSMDAALNDDQEATVNGKIKVDVCPEIFIDYDLILNPPAGKTCSHFCIC